MILLLHINEPAYRNQVFENYQRNSPGYNHAQLKIVKDKKNHVSL